ncbi:23S rRNA (uracil(1939)-C(5))-methyltransferase RlmD [Endozoicomonadaceae bacterium StTr2]
MLKSSGSRRRSKPTTELKLKVHGLSHDGRGIARHPAGGSAQRQRLGGLRNSRNNSAGDGKVIFIPGTLPGETVSARITEAGRKFDEARLLEVIEPSTDRTEPACQYFGRCGGCVWQHVDHKRQLYEKQQQVLSLLQRQEKLAPESVAAPLTGPAYGVRSRAGLAVGWHKGKLRFGFRELGSHSICDIQACPLLVGALQKLLLPLRDVLNEHGRGIQRIDLDTGEHATAILIEPLKKLSRSDRAAFIRFGEQHQVYVFQRNSDGGSECLYSPQENEQQNDSWLSYELEKFELSLKYLPSDFTQVNRGINRDMVKQAIDWLDLKPGESMLDLYCGLGNFALPAARLGAKVTGVEGAASSVERAGMNASANGLEGSFHVADLSRLPRGEWADQKYDKILLDPPRAGADAVLPCFQQWQPERVVYVSCNPGTFVRDAAQIVRQGYRMEQLGIMDMFPQTAHVETIALFCKENT